MAGQARSLRSRLQGRQAIETQQKSPRRLRIVGGVWRGRRLQFPAGAAIRPTPDRVRETLFNWLALRLPGAVCLDLFAGSGVVGLEALSRGAAAVTFVDKEAVAARAIQDRLTEWGAADPARGVGGRGNVVRAEALAWLDSIVPDGAGAPFDIVFLDPPFAAGLLGAACQCLERRRLLRSEARIYLEAPAREPLPALPADWEALRSGTAGEVGYHLFRRG